MIKLCLADSMHPLESVKWGERTANLQGGKHQMRVIAPEAWSDTAVDVFASHYLRVVDGEQETHFGQAMGRVAGTISGWAREDGYLSDGEAHAFRAELEHMLVYQMWSPNSPVWYNIGCAPRPQISACLPYDMRVNTDKGLLPIGEIVMRWRRGEKFSTFDKEGRPTKIVNAICNGKRFVMRYELDDGSSLRMTSDHVVFVERAGKIVESKAKDLTSGDRLILSREMLLDGTNTENTGVLWDIQEDDAWLAGLMVGNGFSDRPKTGTSDTWEIKINTATQLTRIESALKERGVCYAVYPFSWGYTVRGYGSVGRGYWEGMGIWGHTHKKIMPEWVFRSARSLTAAFLRGLFDSDGTAVRAPTGERTYVQFGNTQESIMRGAHILLRSMGIFGTINCYNDLRDENRLPFWTVTICDRVSVQKMIDLIGSDHSDKLVVLNSHNVDGIAYRTARVEFVESAKSGTELVYDIQTESATFWAEGVLVHNCFIQSVKDSMEGEQGIIALQSAETRLFMHGSGTGTNLSTLRPNNWPTSRGGTSSGPVSFMRGFDGWAGVTKSGGKTRRAAKMTILNASHPDIFDFISDKAEAERMANALVDAGWPADYNSKAYSWLPFQNANNSVRVTDEFMHAVKNNRQWSLTWDGKTVREVRARDLWAAACEAAWHCGDPGLQFHTTANLWHTSPAEGEINASNPCQPGFATVLTPNGVRTFDEIDVGSIIWSGKQWTKVIAKVPTGTKPVLAYATSQGVFVGTGNHRIITGGERCQVAYASSIDPSPSPPGDDAPAYFWLAQNGYLGSESNINRILPLGTYPVYDITVEAEEHTYWTGGLLVSNCSEYFFLDDSACNLASLNLRKFKKPDGPFEVNRFKAACERSILAQEVMVSRASYPTRAIGVNSEKYRPLGLGYSNLGALLMSEGLAYDSPEGCAYAAAITALMTASAYQASQKIAAVKGPYDGSRIGDNAKAMREVLDRHASALNMVPWTTFDDHKNVALAAAETFMKVVNSSVLPRNAQVTLLAPTGTISFGMDCDTFGIEPDFSLVKHKRMAGGGFMKYANRSVESALRKLGYGSDVEQIVKHVEEHETLDNYPLIADQDRSVFDCAVPAKKGWRSISFEGHVNMMAAVQPFLSGAISKTVNLPYTATVEDISRAYMMAWEKGLKAIAIYRDGCKRSQPLDTGTRDTINYKHPHVQRALAEVAAAVGLVGESWTANSLAEQIKLAQPQRRRLPDTRQSLCHRFSVGGHDGYLHPGFHADGTLGEIFVRMAKEGSTVSGLLDAWATAFSIALQYGAPLEKLCEKGMGTSFPPSGFTGDEMRSAKSVVDYICSWLHKHYCQPNTSVTHMTGADKLSVSVVGTTVEAPLTAGNPPCGACSGDTVRAGSCYTCTKCGTTTGCG